jgi:hypothetical protein
MLQCIICTCEGQPMLLFQCRGKMMLTNVLTRVASAVVAASISGALFSVVLV